MLCSGLEPVAPRWLSQTDPLSYGWRPSIFILVQDADVKKTEN